MFSPGFGKNSIDNSFLPSDQKGANLKNVILKLLDIKTSNNFKEKITFETNYDLNRFSLKLFRSMKIIKR